MLSVGERFWNPDGRCGMRLRRLPDTRSWKSRLLSDLCLAKWYRLRPSQALLDVRTISGGAERRLRSRLNSPFLLFSGLPFILVQTWNHVFLGWTFFWSPYKVFLQFLYLWRVLIKNPDDATLAPLSISSNMQIKTAIIEIPFFGHSSLQTWDKRMKTVSTLICVLYTSPLYTMYTAAIFLCPDTDNKNNDNININTNMNITIVTQLCI